MKSLVLGLVCSAFVFCTPANAQFEGPKVADAKPGDLRVIASGTIEVPLKKVVKDAERAIRKPVFVQFGGSRFLRDDILKGQDFEVVILLSEVNSELRAAGKIQPQSYVLAHVPIGFGIRGDASAVDLGSVAAVKAAFLKAKSIKYAPTGAAIRTVNNILTKLDIRDKIHDSSALPAPVDLGPGEYEIQIYPVSEILAKKDAKSMGPVIAELQVPVDIEAAIGTNARDPKAALAFIRYLQSGKFGAPLKEVGLTPAKARK